MAVYNSLPYLRKAVETVLAQTLRDIEVICVDDGSSDGSLDVLREYAAKDARMKVLRNLEQTDGAGAARNMGVDAATGEYLSIIDSDDVFDPQMLEKSYAKAKTTDADIVIFDVTFMTPDGRTIPGMHGIHSEHLPEQDVFSPKDHAKELFCMASGAAWNKLYRRSFINREHIRFASIHHSDDFGFVQLANACAGRIAILRESLMQYRYMSNGSQSASMQKWPLAPYQATMLLKKQLKEKGLFGQYRATFINHSMGVFLWFLRVQKDSAAARHLYDVMKDAYLNTFGILEVPDEDLDPGARSLRDKMQRMDFVEFLMDWRDRLEHRLSSRSSCIYHLHLGDVDAPVVLYGAGDHGRLMFSGMLMEHRHAIAAWVDRDYARIGYPVQSPERLLRVSFSYVIVTVLSPAAYASIRRELNAMGIPEEKILWAKDLEAAAV